MTEPATICPGIAVSNRDAAELREKLAVADFTEEALRRAHEKAFGRCFVALEDLSAEELHHWICTVDFALRMKGLRMERSQAL